MLESRAARAGLPAEFEAPGLVTVGALKAFIFLLTTGAAGFTATPSLAAAFVAAVDPAAAAAGAADGAGVGAALSPTRRGTVNPLRRDGAADRRMMQDLQQALRFVSPHGRKKCGGPLSTVHFKPFQAGTVLP